MATSNSRPPVSCHIRLATSDDVAAIERIVNDAYSPYIARIGATPGPMLDDYPARVEQGAAYVLDCPDGIQGVIVLLPEPSCMLLDNIAVCPSTQGLGYGRQMMQWAEDRARQLGLASIRLYTQEMMTENIAIYRRYGYVETHRATEIGLNRVFMSKPLG